jgi:CheY-like chemotaxis protein
VSDLSMPNRDGFALVRALRSHTDPGRRRLGVLAVSASYGRDGPERALAEGFDGFLSKPVEPARLLGSLEQLGAAGRKYLLGTVVR